MNEPTALRKYQERDAEVVDYNYVPLEGCSFAIRGPSHWAAGARRIACLGSAATFGRFVQNPFPAQIAQRLGASVINLGFGGARFETYLKEPAALAVCRQSDLVILELMSARSYPSGLFRPHNHLTGKGKIGPELAKVLQKEDPDSPLLGKRVFVDNAHAWAAKNLDGEQLAKARDRLLAAYRRDAIRLIDEIGKPVLLLWLSQRPIGQVSKPGSRNSWDCGFPHFVDGETVEHVRRSAVGLVEIVSTRGIPSPLTSKVTGQFANIAGGPASHMNKYYPSPEMHDDAASKLCDFIAEFWRDELGQT